MSKSPWLDIGLQHNGAEGRLSQGGCPHYPTFSCHNAGASPNAALFHVCLARTLPQGVTLGEQADLCWGQLSPKAQTSPWGGHGQVNFARTNLLIDDNISEEHQSCTERIRLVGDHSASAAPWVKVLASTTYTCAKWTSVVVSALWSNETLVRWDRFLPHAFQEPSAAQPRDTREPSAGQEGG